MHTVASQNYVLAARKRCIVATRWSIPYSLNSAAVRDEPYRTSRGYGYAGQVDRRVGGIMRVLPMAYVDRRQMRDAEVLRRVSRIHGECRHAIQVRFAGTFSSDSLNPLMVLRRVRHPHRRLGREFPKPLAECRVHDQPDRVISGCPSRHPVGRNT